MAVLHEMTDIIHYIENSPEEESIKISIFIAGMQAQKKIDRHFSSIHKKMPIEHEKASILGD